MSAGVYDLEENKGGDAFHELGRQVYTNASRGTYIHPVVMTGIALLKTMALKNWNLKVRHRECQTWHLTRSKEFRGVALCKSGSDQLTGSHLPSEM